jgi:Spy/CpxP family protein refolding chaperone
MPDRRTLVASVLGPLLLIAGLPAADAQHPMPGPGAGSPLPHRLAETCASAFDANVGAGRGFGMAFVADQNGYPGPLHVLELKDRLKLTAEQEAKAEAMLAAMFAESRPRSGRLLAAEDKLRQRFASGQADETAIRALVAEVEKARADVRLVHLRFHLGTRDLLTEEQRRLYHEARWGAHRPTGPHGAGSHGAGAPTK